MSKEKVGKSSIRESISSLNSNHNISGDVKNNIITKIDQMIHQ